LSFDEALFKNTIARDTQYRFSCVFLCSEQRNLVKDQIAFEIAKTISLFPAQRSRSSQMVQKRH